MARKRNKSKASLGAGNVDAKDSCDKDDKYEDVSQNGKRGSVVD